MSYPVFHGKIAIVTGAASGLGQGFATEIAKSGGVVIAADVDLAGVERTVASIRASGGNAEAHRLDVRDAAAVTALVDDTVRKHARLDYIFNNAGIATQGLVEEIPLEQWDEIVDIDLKGVIYGTSAAYKHMVRQGSGQIVNTASLAGLIPAPLLSPYSTVKFGVVGLSDSLRVEARAKGVTVTVLCPGFIESGIYAAARTSGDFSGELLRERIPFVVPLSKGVDRLLRGVAAKKRLVTLPFYAHLLIWTYKLAPSLAIWLSGWIAALQVRDAKRARGQR